MFWGWLNPSSETRALQYEALQYYYNVSPHPRVGSLWLAKWKFQTQADGSRPIPIFIMVLCTVKFLWGSHATEEKQAVRAIYLYPMEWILLLVGLAPWEVYCIKSSTSQTSLHTRSLLL